MEQVDKYFENKFPDKYKADTKAKYLFALYGELVYMRAKKFEWADIKKYIGDVHNIEVSVDYLTHTSLYGFKKDYGMDFSKDVQRKKLELNNASADILAKNNLQNNKNNFIER